MYTDSKLNAYDLAQARLELLIGHCSEQIHQEEQKAKPDLSKIEHWGNELDAVTDQRDALRIDDEATNIRIAQALLPLPGFSSNLPI